MSTRIFNSDYNSILKKYIVYFVCMNFFRRNNKMNVNRGVARAAPGVPVIPPL